MIADLPDEFLWPDYEAGSIANIPATVAAILGVPFVGSPPLRPELWRPLGQGVKRVVVLIIDALGWNLVQQERPSFAALTRGKTAVFDQITSIYPSTTVAALTSIWTGCSPAQHGLVGLNLFFPQYAVMGQMLKFTPTFRTYADALVEAGLKPTEFLAVPGVGEQFQAAALPVYSFKGLDISKSALSQMHGRGVRDTYGVATFADMLVQMRRLLTEKVDERFYAIAYWPTIDTLSHLYGWQRPEVQAELRALLFQLQVEFLQALTPEAAQDTVFFLVADHGQGVTPPSHYVALRDHPELQQMLLMQPAGEARAPYFYARHGRQADVLAYLNDRLGQAMVAMPAETALAQGLFGPPPHAAITAERLGDVVGLMRQGYTFLTERDRPKAHEMVARHAGMTYEEMAVPWLGLRLG